MTLSDKSSLRRPEVIDMIGARKDGTVELGIMVGEKLGGSKDDQKLLMDKVEKYLKAINSERFRKDYHNPLPHKTIIVIKCLVEPDPVILEFVKRMERWVRDNKARIRLDMETVEETGR